MNDAPTYSWDACVVLGWFAAEADKPLDDMALVIEEIEAKRALLLLSVTVYCEVLEIGRSAEAARRFRQFLKRSNVHLANVDPRVAEKAVEIRESAARQGRSIRTPDAQVAATAVVYQAGVLHTFDDKLLKFAGDPTLEDLPICRPVLLGRQQSLRFQPP